MKKIFFLSLFFTAGMLAAHAQTKPTKKAKTANPTAVTVNPMKNLNDSFSYAAGLSIAKSMQQQGVTKLNGALLQQAISDVMNNSKCLLTEEQANMTLQEQLKAYAQKKYEEATTAGLAYQNENKKNPKVISLPNGLQYEILKAGEAQGYQPKPTDTVLVHYVGTTIDGKEFDNSVKRGEPARFPLNRVIKGWTEILGLMTKGAKWRVVIPSDLGYGQQGAGGAIPPNATLIFEIELIDIFPAS